MSLWSRISNAFRAERLNREIDEELQGSDALEVDEGNTAAEELYRRAGYADQSRFLMTKWLTEA